ncbi:hypothetical protein N9W68_00700, partial [Candidatus Pelagibacter bacterium]|nr:hypothetical protein [Candidatus Pelagibacter bacterium]
PRVQEDIRKQVEKTFGNMPAPWETGYDPGSVTPSFTGETREGAYDTAVDSIQTKIDNLQEVIDSLSSIGIGLPGFDEEIGQPAQYTKQEIIENVETVELTFESSADLSKVITFVNSMTFPIGKLRLEALLNDQLKPELVLDLAALEAELTQTQLDADNIKFSQWNNLTQEEQDELVAREREIADQFANGASRNEKISQGSIGKALGSIQEEVFAAYVEAIMDNVEIQELFSILDKIPGAKLVARLIASFDCPNVHFIYPPIKSFLGSLTFDDCLDRGRVAFPRIPRIPKIKTIKEHLMDLTRFAKNEAWSMLKEQVWAAATLKVLLLLENALCKSLEAVGQFAAEATLGSEANFGNVINELFCGTANEGDMDEVSATLLSSVGVTPKKLADLSKQINAADLKGEYKQVMNSISNVVTGDQLRGLFVANPDEADLNVLARVSRTVTAQCPSFGIFFDSPDKVATIFAAMGNFMSPEQREKVRNDLANPIVVVDSNQSICLTQEQLQEYEDKLRGTWTNCGLDPDTIEEIIKKDKDKNQKEVFVTAERLAKGPAGIFKDAIDKALLPEECGDVNGLNSFETPLAAQEASILTEGVFKSLQRTYSKDMIGKKHSFLENVLADTTDLPLKRHERRANSESFYIDYANSAEDWEHKEKRFNQTAAGSFYFGVLSQEEPKGVFPDTVAIKMKEEIDTQTYDVNFTYIPIELPRKETKSVRVGLLGREKDIEIPKPYIKMPDLIMTYDNNKDYRSDFDIDLSYTKYKEGQVKIEKDFGYKVNIKRTTTMTEVDFETEEETERISTERVYGVFSPQQIDQSASVLLAQYDVSEEELNQKKIPYQSYILANFVNSQLQSASHPPISPIGFSKDFYANFINKSFDVLSKGLLNKLDGEISDGFRFGYESDPLSTDDLLYVDPESDPNDESTWEYTFEEEDGVLGRSATKNSRVHFLDPNMYGGKFRSPPLYIEPSVYSGWLGLSQMLVPEIDGCKPKRTDFIDIKQISKNVRKVQTSIPQDPRLKEDPECVKRIPFDKISDSATLAFIDGTVIATIRTYTSEAMLKSMPMLSFLEYSDTNYDDGYAQLIVKEMEEQMPLEDALFGGRIEGYTYWLLFLEQAVQSAVRKLDNGEIESTPEIEAARKAINDAQTSYIYPQKKDLEAFVELKELGQKQVASAGVMSSITLGFFALAFPAFMATSAIIAAPIAITTLFVTLNDLRFSSKIGLIESVKRPCKVLLKALIDNELKFLSSKLSGDDRFRPYVADLSKYYLSLPDFMYGSTLKAGLMDIEKPQVVGELDVDYGDVSEVSPQPTLTDKLIELGLTSDQLASVAEQGGLFIEKYIRTIDKPRQGPSLQSEIREDQQDPPYLQVIRQRPETLKGVCNITEFRQWASVAKEQIPNELNISDLFGDAFIKTGTTGDYEGSIGLKFGIRISLIPNETLKADLATGNWDTEVVAREKSFSFADTSIVPLITYERDIKDIKFVDLDFEDSNLGEDLKCYIDKMVSTENYRLVMDYMFGLRRIPTIMSIYMNHSFVPSVGASESERDDDAKLLGFIDRTSDEWKSVILDDTKSECRRLFASFYRSDDFNPQDDNDASLREVVSRFLPGIFGVNRLLVHWTTRRRLRNRPFDKDGKLCKNAFQRVFSPD